MAGQQSCIHLSVADKGLEIRHLPMESEFSTVLLIACRCLSRDTDAEAGKRGFLVWRRFSSSPPALEVVSPKDVT